MCHRNMRIVNVCREKKRATKKCYGCRSIGGGEIDLNPLVEHKQQLVLKKKEGKAMDKIVRIDMGAEGGPKVSTGPLEIMRVLAAVP